MSDPILPIPLPQPRRPLVDATGALTREHLVTLVDLIRRTGGPDADFISLLMTEAYEAKALALAAQASAAAALGYTTNPADPLSYTITGGGTASIVIAAHTRSTAAAPIIAGTLTGLARGATRLVYYDDAGDLGGAVVFQSTTDPRILNAAGRRLVGAIYLPEPPPRANAV